MKTKTDSYAVPGSNASFVLIVWENGTWVGYMKIGNNEPDTANPITDFKQVPRKIRNTVKLAVAKYVLDLTA